VITHEMAECGWCVCVMTALHGPLTLTQLYTTLHRVE